MYSEYLIKIQIKTMETCIRDMKSLGCNVDKQIENLGNLYYKLEESKAFFK